MKSWIFPFFFLLWLQNGQLFGVIMSISGNSVQSGMLQLFLLPISIVAYMIMIGDFFKIRIPVVRRVYFITFLFVGLYLLSSLFQDIIPYDYWTRFLRFGSICMAGIIAGVHFAYYQCYEKIDKLLPFFIIIMVVGLGAFGLEAALNGKVINADDGMGGDIGLNYQNFSYYMAKTYSYSLYFLFFSSIRGTRYHKMMILPIVIMCIATAVLSIVGGGRGPFLFFVAISVVFCYFYKGSGNLTIRHLWIVVFLLIGFEYFASQLNIFDSFGFTRVIDNMTEDNSRRLLYTKAWNVFLESPIVGHGFGSVWWTVGWACHNMFLDLLAEGGVIGASIVLYFLIVTLVYLWKKTKLDGRYFLILAVFIESIIENTVSGYWISCETIWFSMAFAVVSSAINNRNKIKLKTIKIN